MMDWWRARDPLTIFVFKTLAWMPFVFFGWYLLSGILIWPLTYMAEMAAGWAAPGVVERVGQSEGYLIFNTAMLVTSPDGRTGVVVIEVNALKYAYSLPLLITLLYAASDRYFSLWKMLLIYVLLLPFQLWGVTFEFFAQSLFHAGREVAEQTGISESWADFVALGYQFGYLMLPPISAAAIWIALNRAFVEELVARREVVASSGKEPEKKD